MDKNESLEKYNWDDTKLVEKWKILRKAMDKLNTTSNKLGGILIPKKDVGGIVAISPRKQETTEETTEEPVKQVNDPTVLAGMSTDKKVLLGAEGALTALSMVGGIPGALAGTALLVTQA